MSGCLLGFGAVGFLLVGPFGGEAHQAPAMASRFIEPDARRDARTACASDAPFVVLDTFGHKKPANIDDALFDPQAGQPSRLQHGDIVAAIVEASHPAGAVGYQTNPVFNVDSFAADLGRLATDIETRKLAKPSAIVSSIVLPADLADFNRIASGVAPFTEADIRSRRSELLKLATGNFDPSNPYTEIDRQLGRIRAAGVPIFVAAGNTGPDQTLNVLGLSEGVHTVGALDREGAVASYTSAPDFVSIWSPGYVVLSETADGVSVSGGRKVELRGASLPDEKRVIASFAGKKAEEVVRRIPGVVQMARGAGPSRMRNRQLAMLLTPGLYRTADLMAAYGHAPALGTFARALAEGPYMHFPSDTIFKVDGAGKLVFDPIGDRSPGQVKLADATSFATPNVCATETFSRPYGSFALRN